MEAAQVSVLGSTVLVINGEPVELAARPRAVLTLLAVAAPGTVEPARLSAALWPGKPPPSAANAVQVYVSALRRAAHEAGWVGDFVIRHDRGYLLGPEVRIDLVHLRQATEKAELALNAGDPRTAVEELIGLTDVDVSTVLADLREGVDPGVRHSVQHLLDRARMLFLRGLVDGGQPARALPALLGLCQEYPERGDVVEMTALAHYRTGRPTSALQLVREHRRHLRQDFGLDPAPWLDILERRILSNDPVLTSDADIGDDVEDLDVQTCPHTTAGSPFDPRRCARAAGEAIIRGTQDEMDIGACLQRGRIELGDWGFLDEVVAGAVRTLGPEPPTGSSGQSSPT